jgi:heat shock protein HslJ
MILPCRTAAFLALLAALGAPAPAAADPALAGGREWRVIAVAGQRPPPAARVGFSIASDGRIAGRSGCNRFTGKAEIGGGRIMVGPLAGTRMACPPPLMAVEARFLAVLQSVERYALQRGRLVLTTADGRRIDARRAPRQR